MQWILDAERSRDIDRRSELEFGIPARTLMENAGEALLRAIKGNLPSDGRLVVVCGKGNNGGDGVAAARLAHIAGFAVTCLLTSEASLCSRDMQDQVNLAASAGVPMAVADFSQEGESDHLLQYDLIVDALLGTGAHGPVREEVRLAIQAINACRVPVISADIPSGIDCDSGEVLGSCVQATRTVTFGFPKPFLFQGQGADFVGTWEVAEIGFPKSLINEATDVGLLDSAWVAQHLPRRPKSSHKTQNGHVLILAGSVDMPGAASLAASGALHAGAGLVTVASVEDVCDAVAANVPEALLLRLPERNGSIAPEAIKTICQSSAKWTAALVGPGLRATDSVREFLENLFQVWQFPTCIDAGAFHALTTGVPMPKVPCVLTPHEGEMGKLLGTEPATVRSHRFESARTAANKFGCCTVLKGRYTLVAESGTQLYVNPTGNPGLATGGSGDVLGGVIAAYLGQQMPAWIAAACGVYLHGAAADDCQAQIGSIGYLASDVALALPQARAKLLTA